MSDYESADEAEVAKLTSRATAASTIDDLDLDLDSSKPAKQADVTTTNSNKPGIHPSRLQQVEQPITTHTPTDTNTLKRTADSTNNTTDDKPISSVKRKKFDTRSSAEIAATAPKIVPTIESYGYSGSNNIPIGQRTHTHNNNIIEANNVVTLCGLSTRLQLITDQTHTDRLRDTLLQYFYPDKHKFGASYYRSLPGPLPISVGRKHIQQLINNDYYVCEKSDGERALLYVSTAEQTAYIVDRKFIFRRFIDSSVYCRLCAVNGDTILDGEILALPSDSDTSRQPSHVYMIFDAIIVNGTKVSELALSQRLKTVLNDVVQPYVQLTQATDHNFNITPLELKMKFMVNKKHFSTIRKLVKPHPTIPGHYIFERTDSRGRKQVNGNDGFIFTPEHDTYMQTHLTGLLKWKWPGMNTVDMRIVTPLYNDKGQLNLYTQANTLDSNRGRATDVLVRSTTLSQQSQQKIEQLLGQSTDAIIEFAYDMQTGEWIPKQRRYDKVVPNFITTVISTLETIIDNVTIDEIEKTCSIPTPAQPKPLNIPQRPNGTVQQHNVQSQSMVDDYSYSIPAYMQPQQPTTPIHYTSPAKQHNGHTQSTELMLQGPILRGTVPVWNLESTTDKDAIQYIHQQSIDTVLHQHNTPYVEYIRSIELLKLRKLFNELCTNYLHIDAPRECFNRWLYLQYAHTTQQCVEWTQHYITHTNNTLYLDPLLRAPTLIIHSDVIKHELQVEIPARNDISRFKVLNKAHKTFNNYINALYKWLTTSQYMHSATQLHTQRDSVIQQCDAVQQWYKQNKKCNDIDILLNKFTQLRDTAQPLVLQVMQPHIDTVCQQLYNAVIQSIHTIYTVYTAEQQNPTRCNIDIQFEQKDVRISCQHQKFNDSITIQRIHYDKLRTLYQLKNDNVTNFNTQLYLLIRRYTSVFTGIEPYEGASMHAAVPETGFNQLTLQFSVTQELFASPLNCYFKQLCSAFIDTDTYFGSVGSFFDTVITSGSYECNPPFVLEVMNNVSNRIEELLSRTTEPLSIIVYVPYWNSPPAEYITNFSTSKFLQGHKIIPDKQHMYVEGSQHNSSSVESRYFAAAHDSALYILQNDAGKVKYNVTEQKIHSLLQAQT